MPPTLYLLALAVFAMGTSEFMLAGLLPAIAADLGVPLGAAGMATSAFAVGMVVGAPLTAAFARRWPPRRGLPAFVLVFAVVHVAGALADHLWVLVVTRVAAAFAYAGFLAVALATAVTLVPAERTGRALAVLLSGTTLATVAGVPGGAVLGGLLGWRVTFWAVAVLCLPAAVGIATAKTLRRPDAGSQAERPAALALRAEIAQLARPRLLSAMTTAALVNAGTFGAFTFLAPLITGPVGLSQRWIPVALMLFGLGSWLGVTAAGRLADRWPGQVVAVGGPLALLGWLATAATTHPATLLVLVAVQGALSFAVGSTLVARVLGEATGAPTMGGAYATAALNLGAALGPIAAAATLGTGPAERAPFVAAAVAVALALATASATRVRAAVPVNR
ncbi:Cmx/CmrA family chloramphenicol efflux MFS transporter [Nocardia farcinica]|uniref:Cmx/CmrA family chloramphenicol efflux MFS transporter n=1 Tax=Nocardia farcinica TaxID=37329 RepID=UPI0024586744|nr:Cmx/CmrA family chloramphenicol efflux MFS transporter [Nocardia farcinica]